MSTNNLNSSNVSEPTKEEIEAKDLKKKMFERSVLKKVEELIYITLVEMPFYAALMANFKKEISYEIPVAAVTFKQAYPTLLINPQGFLHYQKKEELFILIHEIIHITDMHLFRGKGKDPGVWNIAADIELNQNIETSFVYRPNDCLMPHHYDLPPNRSAEEYYNILIARDEPIDIPDELKNSLMEDIINGMQGDGDGKDDSDQNGDGSGQPNPNGSLAPGYENLHPHWGDEPDVSEDIAKGIVKGMLQDAMTKSAGKIPGEMTGIIDRLFEPQITWDKHLRTFASSVISSKKRYTWSRPNRKHGMIKMGKIRMKESSLLVAIDTSASLNETELAQFLTEIENLKAHHDIDIFITQCDTKIHSLDNFDDIDINNFEIKGRGGTSFHPVFDLVENREQDGFRLMQRPDGVIYLTDGGGEAPSNSSIRTLWVLSPYGQKPMSPNGGSIDWGDYVDLDIPNR